jgi:thiamine pyrophosphate-dependent acetolactate synthase large subunit-like protein
VSTRLNGTSILLFCSADTGCRVVYGGHGGALVPLVNAVSAHPALRWVYARNEHDAATMAAAHAKYTGGLGCVIATSGPGATNLTTGLLEAAWDKVPLLAVTGMKPTSVIGYSEFQDVNQSRLFAGAGIEWSKDATSADSAIPLLRDAVATALSRRTCVHLAIPVDIQAAASPLKLKHFCASHANVGLRPPRVDAEYVHQAAATLVGVPEERKPRNVIAVGLRARCHGIGGDVHPDISKAILELAEALNAPVLTRLHAKGIVDESHPLSFGVIGVHGKPGLEKAAALISTSDRILSIGVEDETLLLCNAAGLQIRKLIEIQPDAMAVGTRYNAEHTILGDIYEICTQLTERVETLSVKVEKKRNLVAHQRDPNNGLHNHRRENTLEEFGYAAFGNPDAVMDENEELTLPELKETGPDEMRRRTDRLWQAMHAANWKELAKLSDGPIQFECDSAPDSDGYCHPASVLQALSDARMDCNGTDKVSREAVIAVDVGDVTLWASLCLRLTAGSRTLYSEHLGTMGYALNAAIAGILARDGPAGAVVLSGDAGFQMTLVELATFQQMKRDGDKLLCVVFDNQVMGRVAFGFENAAGCDVGGPDYVALAKAYGGDGVLLDDSRKAPQVVRDALIKEGLYIVHVKVDPQVKADMASFKDNSLKVMNSG